MAKGTIFNGSTKIELKESNTKVFYNGAWRAVTEGYYHNGTKWELFIGNVPKPGAIIPFPQSLVDTNKLYNSSSSWGMGFTIRGLLSAAGYNTRATEACGYTYLPIFRRRTTPAAEKKPGVGVYDDIWFKIGMRNGTSTWTAKVYKNNAPTAITLIDSSQEYCFQIGKISIDDTLTQAWTEAENTAGAGNGRHIFSGAIGLKVL